MADTVQFSRALNIDWSFLKITASPSEHEHGDNPAASQKFTTLSGIRRAYSAAFAKRQAKIDSILSNRAIDALSLVRNLVLHSAGVADAMYVADSRNVPAAPKLAVGEGLDVTGFMMSFLIDPVILGGTNLLAAVEEWMQSPGGEP